MIGHSEKQANTIFCSEMVFNQSSRIRLHNAIGCDEAESFALSLTQSDCRFMPPVHHKIRSLWHFIICVSQGFHVFMIKSEAYAPRPNKRRVADDEIGFGPVGLARV